MPIQILPDDVASQIAAGEVVERPASVAKELIENSLDAHATYIQIRIMQAGQSLIQVSDDGDGIPSEELSLAVARHATSKIHDASNLFSIQTLGFRGEALASIGSVSKLLIISRPKKAEFGSRIEVEGGQLTLQEKVGVPVGTVVRVENLFYNVPARLKFLKQPSTERNRINELITRYALAYSGVRWQLFQDNQAILQTSGSGDNREALVQLYGIDVARQMVEVTMEDNETKISGFISPISLTRSNRKEITFFVNGRWIQDGSLTTALLQAYHTLLMIGRYPMAVLFIKLPPGELDVNVHPAKAEVRFRDSNYIFSTVQRAVRRALLAYSPIQPLSPPRWQHTSQPQIIDPAWQMASELKSSNGNIETQTSIESPQQSSLPSGQIPLLRLIGQIGAVYLVAEGPDGLYLIDQHAAHERVLFEQFQKLPNKNILSQSLLEPVIIHLPPQNAQLLTSHLSFLSKYGFKIEEFGPNTFRIMAIPVLLIDTDPASVVKSVVEEFEEDETPLQGEIESRLIARICKRSAIKAGQILTVDEQRALLNNLETCQSPRTCPHGRPTMIHLSIDLMERQFGRRGSR